MDIETQKMYQLIEKYKPDNYTTCSPEDTVFINNYIDKKIQQKDFNILNDMQSVNPEKYPISQNFDLHAHYENLYKELGQKSFPTYINKKMSYSHNIKNVYNRNKNIEDQEGLNRLGSIFKKISNPQIGTSNKVLKHLSDNYSIIFNIIEGSNFDGECRFSKDHHKGKSFIISVTQGSLKANDDALAVLLGHELSHGIDISRIPNNYIGSIGWEAPEDFANIIGADIARNAGYVPAEFIKAQGTNNDKTQRAADMINQYVINFSAPENTMMSDKLKVLRGIDNTTKCPHVPQRVSNIDINGLRYARNFRSEKI